MSLISTLLMKQVMEQYFLSLKGKRPMKGDIEIAKAMPTIKLYNAGKAILGGQIGYEFISDLLFIVSAGDLLLTLGGDFLFGTNLIPFDNNTYDIGSSFYRFKDIWAQGTSNLTKIKLGTSMNQGVDSRLQPTEDDVYDLGWGPLREWRNLYIDGKAYIDQLGEALDVNSQDLNNIGNATLANNKSLNVISGVLTLPNTRPTSPSAGDVRYDPATDTFEIYDGVSWNPH